MFLDVRSVLQPLDEIILLLLEVRNLGFNFHAFRVFFKNAVDKPIPGCLALLSLLHRSPLLGVGLLLADHVLDALILVLLGLSLLINGHCIF